MASSFTFRPMTITRDQTRNQPQTQVNSWRLHVQWRKAAISLVALLTAALALWALIWWIRYPHVPDVAKVDLKQSVAFMAGDEFNRLTVSDRHKYVEAILNKHRELKFADLLRRAMDRSDLEERKKIAKNLQKLPDGQKLGARFMELFLDKFFEMPLHERQQYLTMIALAQNSGEMGKNLKKLDIPDPERFKKDMANTMSRTSPQAQAKLGQFLMDLEKTRRMWGMKSRY